MTAGRTLRADAARNRERVVEAAVEVFGRRGLEAGIPEIAERAGVGKATVYRSFPAKTDLVAAVLVERLRWFEALAREAASADDAWVAFRATMVTAADARAAEHSLGDGIAADLSTPEVDAARARCQAALEALMDRAKAQGAMRADATADDVRLLLGGVLRVLAADGERDPATWRRCAELICDALAAR